MIYVEGSYYAVGNNETILQTAQADASLRITRLPGTAEARVEILGELGRSYRLQGSMDMAAWTELLTFVADTEPTRYSDDSPTGEPWRFYRAIAP